MAAKHRRILIVDPDSEAARELWRLLIDEDIDAEITEAMEKIETVKPDLILLDIMMERMDDGFTICYQLKRVERLLNV